MTPATIERRFKEAASIEQPDLLLVLNLGLVAGTKVGNTSIGDDGFRASLTLLHERDQAGARIPGTFLAPPLTASDTQMTVGSRTYPIVRHGNQRVAVEPARAFLVFLAVLTEALADHWISERPILNRYLQRSPGFYAAVPLSETLSTTPPEPNEPSMSGSA